MTQTNPTPEQVADLLEMLNEHFRENKIYSYHPYDWQKRFHDAGLTYRERMLMAANRVGKTLSAGAEVAIHATGLYPDWWEGRRFDKEVLIWVGSVTNEASRDIVQKELLGGPGEKLGTGWIPKRLIEGKPSNKQAGISDVVDGVKVRHVSGGLSEINFKTYDQGWRKWQGTAPHVVWLDEEPDDNQLFTEAETRLMTTNGTMIVTFTPLMGETEIVSHFLAKKPGTFLLNVSWDDAPHLSDKDKAEMASLYPEHERDARTKGIPMLGEGRVFPVSEESLRCKPFDIPEHWYRICGVDFGIEHPAAAAWIAWDRDSDTYYLYDCYKQANQVAVYHAEAIKRRGAWIPVAWPHDGINKEKSGGDTIKNAYLQHGVNMLAKSARYDEDKGGAQPVEPIVLEVTELMKTGRFKVFATCDGFFEEFRSYHRKGGKLAAHRDDILKATFYALMMRRYSMPEYVRKTRTTPTRAIIS